MALEKGTTLGLYEILSPLGAGGMGEVYLATDAKLDRQVAIKVLPESMMRDAERVARFEREAKLLASLNHPNIAAVYGFEDHRLEAGATHFIVMEYVEGETLGSHLKNGPVAVEDALDIAKQIAEALEAAHGQGVIHRDLKPANVMIRPDGTVKVLDFGLAKAMAEEASGSEPANSPTITANFTRPGVVLGTAAYMSPEQARGRALDKRTDIWSLGIILFECLTGERLFQGETANDSMGAIMHKDPEWTLLPPDTPPTIQLLLRRCLTKDRKRRLQDIGDARIELENAIVDPTASSLGLASAALRADRVGGTRRILSRTLPWITVLLAISLGVSIFGPRFWNTRKPQMPVHLDVKVSADAPLRAHTGAQAILSPDGTRLVFGAGSGAGTALYVRRLDQSEAAPLSGTEGAIHPFFSPDGEWIGFFAQTKLKKVSVSGGAAISLCDVRIDSRGGTWSSDGTIIFVPNTTTGLWRVQEAGGTPEELTTLNKEENERSHRWPQVLPGGRAILFTSQTKSTDFNDANIEVLSLDTGERKVLHHGGSYGRYLPSGHIVFIREGTLFAAPLDIKRLEVTATPAPILEGVTSDSRNGGAQFAFSETGTLIYYQGSQAGEDTSLVWVDRAGKTTPLLETIRSYGRPRLSPGGKRLALQIAPSSAESDIWVYDIERGALTRLTFDAGGDWVPVWSPDGTRIAFTSRRDNVVNLYRKLADGSGKAERLTTTEHIQIPSDWSPDGKRLAYTELGDETGWDIWVLGLDDDRQAEPFLRTEFGEGDAVFSPDGHWLAYGSDESGQGEVYVRPFPKAGGKWQVSTDGGDLPVWSPDGKELFYRNGDAVMVVSVTGEGSSFRAEKPDLLFELESASDPFSKPYDIAPDGQRFVWVKREEAVEKKDRAHLRFIFNWFDEVEAKVPTDRN